MNTLTFPLLRFLSDGRYRTFGEIADALGISSAEIANMLDVFPSLGLGVERDAGGGCRLITPVSLLDAKEIAYCLGDLAGGFKIEVVDHTGSTNDDLMVRARQGGDSGLVRVAELQTAGRGRRQRMWHSGFGGALTFSVLWTFAMSPAALSGLSLAVGVSLVRSLRAAGVPDIALKWPNDILWRQRKLGGVLIETTGSLSEAVTAVIGIGLNVRLSTRVVGRIDQAATDLHAAGVLLTRNALLGRILLDLQEVLNIFSHEGFAAFKGEWERVHAYQDKMVCLDLADGTQEEGRMVGVDEDGALLLADEAGTCKLTRKFNGGELSMRPTRA